MRKISRVLLTIVVILTLINVCNAQSKHWVYFKDTNNNLNHSLDVGSSKSLNQLHLDYLNKFLDLDVIVHSKWLNAASYRLNDNQIRTIECLSFVEKVKPVLKLKTTGTNVADPQLTVEAIRQTKGNALNSAGLTGKGVKVGIIDVGFIKADITPSLKPLFKGDQVMEVKDFLLGDNHGLFSNVISNDDSHGTAVWQMIAGVDNRVRFGLATDAQFYLARTDHGKYEFRAEEDKWIEALEWLHGQGVRLVNSSVGYSIDFDIASEDHSPSDLDGKTLAISRAAQIAVKEKNMIIVVAAGNEGESRDWKILNAPADAEDVISVGATDWSGFKRSYSAEGPHGLAFVKPDVSIYSDGGTSLAAPVITGMIACLLEKNPNLTNDKIKKILKKSSSLYPYKNNYVGYGVPNAVRMMSLMKSPDQPVKLTRKVKAEKGKIQVTFRDYPDAISLFHKKDQYIVMKQEQIEADQKIILEKMDRIQFTTIVTETEVIEVEW